MFIAKFDPTGRTLLWATYLGGDGPDVLVGAVLDSTDNIYLVGTSSSSNFPFTVHPAGGVNSNFALKLSGDGRTLLYSVSLPFTPQAIAVNAADEAIVGGLGGVATTGSLNASGTMRGSVSLLKLNVVGNSNAFVCVLGGPQVNASVKSLAVDEQGSIYVAGTATDGVLTTATSFQPMYSNAGLQVGNVSNGFLLKVNSFGTPANLRHLFWSSV